MKLKVFVIMSILFTVSASGFNLGLEQQTGKAAIIQLSGGITPTSPDFPASGGITPEKVRELNDRAARQSADAVIYEINSGGGAVVASKEVKREIESVEVPTVCRIRDVGASGAYLASLGCDRIVADSSSLTGSIGVKASYLEFSGLLEKYGIEYVNITAGERKDVGSKFKDLDEKEREILQQKVEKVHEDFISMVDQERNLSDKELARIRTGEAFLGTEAEETGLVDELGGRQKSVELAENMSSKDLSTFKVEDQQGLSFLSLLNSRLDIGNIGSELMLKSTLN